MYEAHRNVKRFLPPSSGSSKPKYVDYGKVPGQQHTPAQLSAHVGIEARDSTNEKSWIHYQHVGSLCSDSQCETGPYSKNETGHLKPKSGAVGVKTGTPEIYYFLQSYTVSICRRCQQSHTVTRSQLRVQVVRNLSQLCWLYSRKRLSSMCFWSTPCFLAHSFNKVGACESRMITMNKGSGPEFE